MPPLPAPHPAFHFKKSQILAQLALPADQYADASPKGSVDAGIRDLIDEINQRDGLVTTSSCAGRVSVFVEGSKKIGPGKQTGGGSDEGGDHGEEETERTSKPASASGGKGGGGTWLFVSHDPVGEEEAGMDVLGLLGLDGVGGAEERMGEGRLIHFKFEPMILHILTASPQHAQLVLKCGLQAGFRESGAVSILEGASGEPATPMVAVRSMGLSFESLVGCAEAGASGRKTSFVSEAYLRLLVRIANERFAENEKRIARFLEALRGEMGGGGKEVRGLSRAEEKEMRRESKRAEGLRRQAETRRRAGDERAEDVEVYIDDLAADTNLS